MENLAYVAWIARDKQALCFLLNSLSPDILSHVLGVSSTVEAWSTIDNMFKTAARSKVQHLRIELNDTKKLNMTADQYYTKMKGFASELAALGKPLEDDELMGYLLRGLNRVHYNALITSINGNPNIMLDEIFGQLSSYDMRNSPQPESEEGFSSSANLARRGSDRDYRPRGHSSERGRPEHGRQEQRGGNGDGRSDRREGQWR